MAELTEEGYAAGIPPWCGVRGIEAHKCMMLCWSLCATLERGEAMPEEDCKGCEEYSPLPQPAEHELYTPK